MSVSVVVVGAERSGDTATLLPHFPLPPSHPFPFSFLIPHPSPFTQIGGKRDTTLGGQDATSRAAG
jgi:hypothetical protein